MHEGIRFLNPCEEDDYGRHMLENPKTHEVFGVTPAGKYHIRVLDLNAPHLVRERRQRAKYYDQLVDRFMIFEAPDSEISIVLELLDFLKELVGDMICPIPYQSQG